MLSIVIFDRTVTCCLNHEINAEFDCSFLAPAGRKLIQSAGSAERFRVSTRLE